MRFFRSLATFGVAAGMVAFAAACSNSESCNGTGNCNVGGNPLAPGTSNEVTGVQVFAWNKDITIGSGVCEADVTVEATILPSSAPQKVDKWETNASYVKKDDKSIILKLRASGVYTVVAVAQGKSSVTETITLKCGTQPPGPGQTFSLDYTPAGGTFSIPVSKGATGFCRDLNGNIISCPADLQVRWEVQGGPFGTNPSTGLTTTVSANTTGQSRICLVAVNYPSVAPVCFVWVAVQDSSPSPATLTVSPTTLNFQLAGSGCVATGAQPITISANNPVTIAVHNPSLANVSATRLEAGNDQRVFVNSVGNVAGSTQITVSSGGISRTVTVNLNGCAAQLSCADRSAEYQRTDGSTNLTVAVNQNVGIRLTQQSGWPTHCEVFYGVFEPSKIKALGTIPIEVCSSGGCFWYGGGKFATVTGVWPDDATDVFAQVVFRENMGTPNERWVPVSGSGSRSTRPWRVVASGLNALGIEMPEGPKWVLDSRVPGGKICLTFECR